MTNTPKNTTTHEATFVTEVRKAALSTIKGESQRTAATIALSSMDILSYGIPQDDIIEAGDITKWLKGDDENGVLGFVKAVGWEDWNNLDPVKVTNSTMQDILREVAYVVAAGEKKNWWADMDNKNSDCAVKTKDDLIYVKTKNFPGLEDDTLPVRDLAFRKLYSAARRVFSKPTVDSEGKNDAALMRRFRLLYLDENGDPTLVELSPEAIDLIPQLRKDMDELMEQFEESGHRRPMHIADEDRAAVA